MQQGMQYAARMREMAAQRVMQATPAAGVPAAVGAVGAGLSAGAANILSKLTPEQRAQLMGDIGSDTGLAAAIMNRGQ